MGESTKLHLIFVKEGKGPIDKFINFFTSMATFTPGDTISEKLKSIPPTIKPLFIFTSNSAFDQFNQAGHFDKITINCHYQIKQFSVKHTSHFKPEWRAPFKRTQATLHFIDLQKKSPRKPPIYANSL